MSPRLIIASPEPHPYQIRRAPGRVSLLTVRTVACYHGDMRFLRPLSPILAVCLVSLAACGGGTSTNQGGGGNTTGGGGAGGSQPTPACTQPTAVTCADQIILDLNLQSSPVDAPITNTADGAGWTTHVDATAGGFGATTPTSYTYGKFTATGLEKVDISDEDSLTSMDWDIAFRRYIVRLNSLDSGPSCVQAARLPTTTKYEDVTALPTSLDYFGDATFTAKCELIPDGTSLGSPATALSSYWDYPGCVRMTHRVFVIALADGRHVKFTVDDFYSPDVQDQCDTTGAVPMSNTGSANFVVRWAYVQ
jgi:hypothetical protein